MYNWYKANMTRFASAFSEMEDDPTAFLRIDFYPDPTQPGGVMRVYKVERVVDHFIPNPFPGLVGDWHPDEIDRIHSIA